MKIDLEFDYPADVQTVYLVLGDLQFLEAMHTSFGHRDIAVTANRMESGRRLLAFSHVVDADIPGVAKRVLGRANTVRQTEEWGPPGSDGSRTGQWTAHVAGTPVRMKGALYLNAREIGCVHRTTADVTVGIPIVGGKIADLAGRQVMEQLRREAAFTKTWLTRNN